MDKQAKFNLGIVIVAALMMMLTVYFVSADSSTATATATVPASCGISLNDTAPDFGSVTAGSESSEVIIQVSNTGSVSANVTIEGTNWTDGGSNTFAVGYTKYALTSGTYASKTALTESAVQHMTDLANGDSDDSFLQMSVPSGQAAATYTQTITYTTVC